MRRSGNGSAVVAGRSLAAGGAFGQTATLLAPKKKNNTSRPSSTSATTRASSTSSKRKQKQQPPPSSQNPPAAKKTATKSAAASSSAKKGAPSAVTATTSSHQPRSNEQRFFVDSYRAALKELQRADVLHLGNVDHVVRGIFGSLMDVDTLVESGLYRPAGKQSPKKKSSSTSPQKRKKDTSKAASAAISDSFMQFNGVAAASHYARYVAQLESHLKGNSSSDSSSGGGINTLYSNDNIAALAPAIRLFFENPALALEVAGLSDVSYLGSSDADGGDKTVENWLEKGVGSGDGSATRIADKHELFQATRFRLCLDFIRSLKASTIGLPVNGVYQTRLLLGGHAPTSHHQQQLPSSIDTTISSKKKKDDANNSSSTPTPTPSSVYTYPVLRTPHVTESHVVIESMSTSPPGTPKANFESALSVVEDTIPFLKGNDPNNKHVERSDGIAYPRGVVTPGSLSRIAVPRSPTSDPATSSSSGASSNNNSGGQQGASGAGMSPPAGSIANAAMAPDPFAPPTVPDRFRLGNGLINLCVPIDPFHIQNVIETRPCTLTPIALLIEALAHAARSNGQHHALSSTTAFYPVVRNSEAVRYMSVPEVQFLPHTATGSANGSSIESNAAAKARSIFGMDDKIGKSNINNSDKDAIISAGSTNNNTLLAFNRVKGVVTVAEIPGVDEDMMDAVKASQLPSPDKKQSSKEAKEEAAMFAKGMIGMNILAKQVATVLTHPTLLRAFYPFYAYMSGGISTWSLENANPSTPSSNNDGGGIVVASRTLPRVVDRDTGASIASLRDAALATIPQSGVWYLPTLTIGSRAASPIQGGIAAHLKLLRGMSCAAFMRDCFVATAATNSRSSSSSSSTQALLVSKSTKKGGDATSTTPVDAESQALQNEADRWLHTIAVLNGTSPDVGANEKAIALPTKTREYLIASAEEELKKLEDKGWKKATSNINTATASNNGQQHAGGTDNSSSSSAQRTMLPRGGGGLLASGAVDGSSLGQYGPHAAQYYRTQYSPITDPAAFFSRLSSINLANTLPTTTITETNGIVRVTVTTQYMGARDPAEEGDMLSGNFTTCDMVTKRLLEKGTHAAASGKRATSDALGLQEGYLHYYQYSVTIQNISSSKSSDANIPHSQAILTGRRPSKIALLSRHWVFCDALGFEDHGTVVPSHNNSADNGAASPLVSREMVPGVVREVVGPGVVGNNPILAPGQTFTYDSGVCCKRSDGVYMRGKLQFVMLDDVVEFEDESQAKAASLVSTSSPPDVRENGVVLSTLVSSLPESVVSSAVQMYRMAKEALPTITVHKYFPTSVKKSGNGKKGTSTKSGPSYALRLDMPTSWMRSKPIPEHHFDAHIAATALRAEK